MGIFGPPDVDKLASKRDVAGLIKALGYTKDKDVRRAAIRALGEVGDSHTIGPLIATLNDSEEDVRRAAVETLAEIGDVHAVEPLIVALKGSIASVDHASARLLAKIGAPAIEPLIVTLKDTSEYVRGAVTLALSEIGALAVEPLISVLGDLDVRQAAAKALAEIGEPAIEPLIVTLKDTNEQVRQAASWALGWMSDPRIVEPLLATLTDVNSDEGAATAPQLQSLRTRISILPAQHPGPGMVIGYKDDEWTDRQARQQIPTICQNIDDALNALDCGRDPVGNPITRDQVGDGLQRLIKATRKSGWDKLVSIVLSPQGIRELKKRLREVEAIAQGL